MIKGKDAIYGRELRFKSFDRLAVGEMDEILLSDSRLMESPTLSLQKNHWTSLETFKSALPFKQIETFQI